MNATIFSDRCWNNLRKASKTFNTLQKHIRKPYVLCSSSWSLLHIRMRLASPTCLLWLQPSVFHGCQGLMFLRDTVDTTMTWMVYKKRRPSRYDVSCGKTRLGRSALMLILALPHSAVAAFGGHILWWDLCANSEGDNRATTLVHVTTIVQLQYGSHQCQLTCTWYKHYSRYEAHPWLVSWSIFTNLCSTVLMSYRLLLLGQSNDLCKHRLRSTTHYLTP